MPARPRRLAPTLLLFAALALGGCEGKEARAEGHYQRGLDYAAAGDLDRARIEFRNVFRLNPAHGEARLAFARLLRDAGDAEAALEQYLLLVDQDRGSLEGQRELAALALGLQDFATAAAAAGRALEIAPADPEVRALKATLDYRAAGEDVAARAAALEIARAVLAETPASVPAHMVLIADAMNAGDPAAALARADAALAAVPGDEGLHLVRLAALERLGDTAGVGAEIARMTELFPDNAAVAEAQVQWLMGQGDLAGAEAALRELAARDPAAPEPALTVARFLYETAGPEAARAELDRLVAAAADPLPFQRARAGLDFAEGRRDEAIAALRALTTDAEAGDRTRDIQADLAAMLDAAGDAAGRDALIAAVLAGDAGHVGALKLRARAAIAADNPDLAIQDLRRALAAAPRDPEILTIMAIAHEREGSRELAGERLALAVEVSGQAPGESLRYARFLMQDGRLGPAEGVAAAALRRAPDDPELLLTLGQIHVARRDWSRVDQVAGLLRAQGDPAALEMATGLEMASLAGQDRAGESLEMLRGLAGTGENAAAMGQLMQAYVAASDFEAAQTWLDGLLAADPASLPGRMMQAGLMAVRGETAEAEALYRALIAEAPALPQPHQALFALLAGQGRVDDAEAALAAGLPATGDDPDLLFLQAGLLESRGDVDGAIAVYERLYARDSANPLLANNLASLLTTHRTDPASLERAFAIARRLRGSDVPHFQDTFGWILHRRGDSAGALPFLETAAAALPDNPLVQLHLGEALHALDRPAEARARFLRVLELAGGGEDAARARLAEIDAAPAAVTAEDADPDG